MRRAEKRTGGTFREFVRKYSKWGYALIIPALVYLADRIAVAFLVASRIERTNTAYWIIFLLSTLLVLLFYFAARNLILLYIERRKQVLGSIIKSKLTLAFLGVTIIPVVLLSFFIVLLVDTGIDALYDPDIETALDTSMQSIREQRRKKSKQFQKAVISLRQRYSGKFTRKDLRAGRIQLQYAGRVEEERFFKKVFPGSDRQSILDRAANGPFFSYTAGETPVLVYFRRIGRSDLVEYAVMQLPASLGRDALKISSALRNYRQLRRVKNPMRIAFIYISLLLIILVTTLVILVALRVSRGISEPIIAITEATHRVAAGNLDFHVDIQSNDETGMLIDYFNAMTDDLKKSRIKLFHAEKIAAWQEVARRLAHEIKNPLTPIQLAADRVYRQYQKNPDKIGAAIERAMPAIRDEVDVIRRLVDEFASFARLPEKRLEKVPVNAFFASIVESFRQVHEDVRFELELLDEDVVIDIDSDQIRRALSNLLQNSINALRGREEPRIQVQVTKEKPRNEQRGGQEAGGAAKGRNSGKTMHLENSVASLKDKHPDSGAAAGNYGETGDAKPSIQGSVIFSIVDNGKGVSDEEKEKIFNPYFSATEGGTGLGLAIVEKIVVDHNGKIWFNSQAGWGTAFYVELPYQEAFG